MAERFVSKIDGWLVSIIGASFAFGLAAPFWAWFSTGDVTALGLSIAILLPVAALVVWLFRSTYYLVTADVLMVKAGPFRWVVSLAEIESVTDSRNPLSSPALSLDRLEIRYSGDRRLLVSPKDKPGFRAAIKH